MHESLAGIEQKMFALSVASLAQAQTNTMFWEPDWKGRDLLAPILVAHSGELLIKAIIAREHPLLIFKNLFETSKSEDIEVDLTRLLEKGQTHDFSKLPALLKATVGESVPNLASFERIRVLRNQIQHFSAPQDAQIQRIVVEFIYENIDPLLNQYFDSHACEHHHDTSIDYIVAYLVRSETRFSIPEDLELTEIQLGYDILDCSAEYQIWLSEELTKKDLFHLLDTEEN